MRRLLNPRLHPVCQLNLEDNGCMLKNHFCSIFDFGGSFAVISKARVFEVTNFWIDVLGADDAVVRLASRFQFRFHQIRRKLMFRVITAFTGFG